jgi:2,3-bisphosphoglycerate-dependent phosphoglycerate mutase
MPVYKVVLLRHGKSAWNEKNLFTGWYNPSLTDEGVMQAKKAGTELKKSGYKFDMVFTNLHKRTLQTLKQVLLVLRQKPIVEKSWRLNERHYGALIGLNKAETAKKYGEKQVFLWRRSYSVRPPMLQKSDKRYKKISAMYKDVPKENMPLAESLRDTYKRTLPYWNNTIVPAIKSGKKILIVASGNSLRSIVKHLDKIPDNAIPEFTIPYSVPLVYEFGKDMRPIRHYYLGSESEIKKTLQGMAVQGKAK